MKSIKGEASCLADTFTQESMTFITNYNPNSPVCMRFLTRFTAMNKGVQRCEGFLAMLAL